MTGLAIRASMGVLTVAASLASPLTNKAAAQSDCRYFRGEMNGAAGQACSHTLPLSWDTPRGLRARHASIVMLKTPSSGEVTFRADRSARGVLMTYRPSGRGPTTDFFAFERCGEVEGGNPDRPSCRVFEVKVTLSEEGRGRSDSACLPKPFPLQPGRTVDVPLKGRVGEPCGIRLFLTPEPVDITIDAAPRQGRAWISRNRVFYRSQTSGSDAFRVRMCERKDPSSCAILNVTVDLS